MVTEESTLRLVEKAKKKLEDGAVEKVASHNNPSPLVAFNNIMRKYYDSNGNPIQQKKRNNITNENREIVSSVQPITKKTKREALTLDLLLPKRELDG